MTVTDYYVYRNARMYIELHGDEAVPKARERVADLQTRGDPVGADIWLRVIVAVEEIRRPHIGPP